MQIHGADLKAADVIIPGIGGVDVHQGSLMGVVTVGGSREAGTAWDWEWGGTPVVRRGC